MNEIILITKYVRAWSYFLLANMFLIGSLIIYALPTTTKSIILITSLFLLFAFMMIRAFKHRNEVLSYE